MGSAVVVETIRLIRHELGGEIVVMIHLHGAWVRNN